MQAIQDETYNGYANYETWLLCLWIDNDQGFQEMAREFAQEQTGDAYERDQEFREWCEESLLYAFANDNPSGFLVDVVNHALARIDWREVRDTRLDA